MRLLLSFLVIAVFSANAFAKNYVPQCETIIPGTPEQHCHFDDHACDGVPYLNEILVPPRSIWYNHACVSSSLASPKIQVYSRNPGEFGKDNTLICHVSDFHPPDIEIKLMKNGQEIPDAKQTDLAFEKGWKFHLTKSVPFKPASGDVYTCEVRHQAEKKTITWDADM